MNPAVGQIEQGFGQVGNDAVAKGSDAYRADIPDDDYSQEGAAAMEREHGCCDQRAQQHVQWVQAPEQGRGYCPWHTCEDEGAHDDNAGQGAEHRERSVRHQFGGDGRQNGSDASPRDCDVTPASVRTSIGV